MEDVDLVNYRSCAQRQNNKAPYSREEEQTLLALQESYAAASRRPSSEGGASLHSSAAATARSARSARSAADVVSMALLPPGTAPAAPLGAPPRRLLTREGSALLAAIHAASLEISPRPPWTPISPTTASGTAAAAAGGTARGSRPVSADDGTGVGVGAAPLQPEPSFAAATVPPSPAPGGGGGWPSSPVGVGARDFNRSDSVGTSKAGTAENTHRLGRSASGSRGTGLGNGLGNGVGGGVRSASAAEGPAIPWSPGGGIGGGGSPRTRETAWKFTRLEMALRTKIASREREAVRNAARHKSSREAWGGSGRDGVHHSEAMVPMLQISATAKGGGPRGAMIKGVAADVASDIMAMSPLQGWRASPTQKR